MRDVKDFAKKIFEERKAHLEKIEELKKAETYVIAVLEVFNKSNKSSEPDKVWKVILEVEAESIVIMYTWLGKTNKKYIEPEMNLKYIKEYFEENLSEYFEVTLQRKLIIELKNPTICENKDSK